MNSALQAILLAACVVCSTRAIAETKRDFPEEIKQAISDIQDMARQRDANDAKIVELRNQVDQLERVDDNAMNELMDGYAEVEASVAEGGLALVRNDRMGAGDSIREATNSFVDTYTSALDAAGNEMTARDLEDKIDGLKQSNREISRSISNSIGALIAIGPMAMSGASASAATNSFLARVSAASERVGAVASAREAQRERERVARERVARERREGRQEGKDRTSPRGRVDVSDPDNEMTLDRR